MRKALIPAVFAAGLLAIALPAQASTVTADFSGSLNGNAVSGNIVLDVVGGTANSGTGNFTGFGLVNVPMVLITTSTPGNETTGGPSFPVGFRDNFGTDLFGADQVYPPDTAGLLFDVNTSLASWGAFPLFALASGTNNSAFTGCIGGCPPTGTEYYVQLGTVNLTETPLPAALPLFTSGLGVVGYLSLMGRKKKRKAQNLPAE